MDTLMKAITIWQPYASLVACGAKKYETRSRPVSYRGPISIHAAMRDYDPLKLNPYFAKATTNALKNAGLSLHCLPLGYVIATAELVGCWKIGQRVLGTLSIYLADGALGITGDELIFGDWTPGRYALELANVKRLDSPIPAKGQQGLWTWKS